MERRTMKTSALILVFALAGLDALAASIAAATPPEIEQYESNTGCRIPNVVGLPQQQAVQVLANADFQVRTVESRPSGALVGRVIDQRPQACSQLGDNRYITLVVSSGSVSQDDRERRRDGGGPSVGTVAGVAAVAAIGVAILASRNRNKEPRSNAEKVDPPKSQTVAAQEQPKAVKRTVVVPSVIGLTLASTRTELASAQLRIVTTNPAEAQAAGAFVAMQVPAAGTAVVPGASVAVTFVVPPPPATVPPPAPPVTIAPPVSVAPPVTVTPPPSTTMSTPPMRPPQRTPIVRVPTPPPVSTPIVEPFIPSSPIAGLMIAPRAIKPFVFVAPPSVDPAFPWWWMLVAVGLIAAIGFLIRRQAIARGKSVRPANPAAPPLQVTFIPRLDDGRQAITAGNENALLDVTLCLDAGSQQLGYHSSRKMIGA